MRLLAGLVEGLPDKAIIGWPADAGPPPGRQDLEGCGKPSRYSNMRCPIGNNWGRNRESAEVQTIIDWLTHRFTKSRYPPDRAVEQFARVAQDQGLPLDYSNDRRLAELLGSDDPAGNIDEIAKLLGRRTSPSRSGWTFVAPPRIF